MIWKKIGKAILYPHLAIILLLFPLGVALTTLSLVYLDTTSVVSILSYILAFYTLVVICFRIPRIITFFKKLKSENKYVIKFLSDERLRINISLYGSLIWNGVFAIFQLVLSFVYKSNWFFFMAAYYIILAVMRFFLLKHTRVYKPREQEKLELKKYCFCGWLLLVMNIALSLIIFFIVYWDKTFNYHYITTIALAAYTFVTFTFAIINYVKYRQYKSPVYSAAKLISLIAACVSMLTLETAMLNVFGADEGAAFKKIMISCTGAVIALFCIVVSIIIIINGTKKIKNLKGQLPTVTGEQVDEQIKDA